MAETRIWQMNAKRDQSVAKCLRMRIDYARDPVKTDGGRLVSSYGCDPDFAAAEFAITKRAYFQKTGREQKREVVVYHVVQSFYTGEITPEEANRVGFEFAKRFTGGDFAFIVGTHVNTDYIHNHIVWNSTSIDGAKKHFDYPRSDRDVRRVSDQICREHGLYVIEEPGRPDTDADGKKPLRRDVIRSAIDSALLRGPKDLKELAEMLKKDGLRVRTGEQTEVKLPGDKEYVRLKTLGEGYTEEDLIAALEVKQRTSQMPVKDETAKPERIPLFSELEAKIGEGRGEAYERVMKVLRLKQMAETLVYMEEHGFGRLEQLSAACADTGKRFTELGRKIKDTESEIAKKKQLRTQVANYKRTDEVWKEYRGSGWSEDYLTGHEGDIILHRAAAEYFKEIGLKKLPSVQKLDKEISRLTREKESAYKEYREIRKESRELETHRANAEYIMDILNRNGREAVPVHE